MRTQLWQLLHACTTPVLISDRPPPTTSMTTTVSCCLLDLPQIDLGGPTKMFPPRSTAEVWYGPKYITHGKLTLWGRLDIMYPPSLAHRNFSRVEKTSRQTVCRAPDCVHSANRPIYRSEFAKLVYCEYPSHGFAISHIVAHNFLSYHDALHYHAKTNHRSTFISNWQSITFSPVPPRTGSCL
jgi:hypothetical protein